MVLATQEEISSKYPLDAGMLLEIMGGLYSLPDLFSILKQSPIPCSSRREGEGKKPSSLLEWHTGGEGRGSSWWRKIIYRRKDQCGRGQLLERIPCSSPASAESWWEGEEMKSAFSCCRGRHTGDWFPPCRTGHSLLSMMRFLLLPGPPCWTDGEDRWYPLPVSLPRCDQGLSIDVKRISLHLYLCLFILSAIQFRIMMSLSFHMPTCT